MILRLLLLTALVAPQMALAADLSPRRHHVVERRSARPVVPDRVFTCTTTSVFGLFSYSNCGGGFDPLAVAAN